MLDDVVGVSRNSVRQFFKCKDHDHRTGTFRGSARSVSDLKEFSDSLFHTSTTKTDTILFYSSDKRVTEKQLGINKKQQL